MPPDLLRGNPQLLEDVEGYAVLVADQSKQQVLRSDIVMSHPLGFFNRVLQDLLGAWGKIDFAAAVLAGAGQAFDDLLDAAGFEAQFTQYTAGDPSFFSDQAEQKMLCSDIVVAHSFGFLVRQAEHTACPLGETIHYRHDNFS